MDIHDIRTDIGTIPNKRRFARLDIALSVNYLVRNENGEPSEMAEAMSSDISAGGFRLMTPRALRVGSTLDLEVSIEGDRSEPIQVVGEVVWQNYVSDASYETGIVIRHMLDKDKQRFMSFVFDQMSRLMGVPAQVLH